MSDVNGAEDFPLETKVINLQMAKIYLHTLFIRSIRQLGITPEDVLFKISLLSRWACLQREINLTLSEEVWTNIHYLALLRQTWYARIRLGSNNVMVLSQECATFTLYVTHCVTRDA